VSAVARKVSKDLVRRLGERKFDMWFGDATRFRIGRNTLEVFAPSAYIAQWIETHFLSDLKEAAEKAMGTQAEVIIRVDPAVTEPASNGSATVTETSGRPAGHASARGEAKFSTRYRLEGFVVGPSNKLAYQAARHVAEAPASDGLGPVFIYGECGLGKTHLLQGVCHRFLERHPEARVRYTTSEAFTNEYIQSLQSNSIDAFRRRIRRLDLLAIDDVHFLSNKEQTQKEFLHTLDAIDHAGAKIIMASDEHPRHLRQVSRALVSRFMAGMIAQIERPDREMRAAIIRHLAAGRRLRLNDQAVAMIASNCVGSVREIEGALTRLDAMRGFEFENSRSNGEIGCLLVQQLFHADVMPTRPVRIQAVIDSVCESLGVEKGDLLGPTRHARVVLARGLSSFLARELTTMSFPEIGRALGRRNHSTVLTAARRVQGQIGGGDTIDLPTGRVIPIGEFAEELKISIRKASA